MAHGEVPGGSERGAGEEDCAGASAAHGRLRGEDPSVDGHIEEGDGVARGQDDDVGARDDAGALRLELRLGVLDDVHPAEPLVLVVVHLRVVAPALDQHRRVASLR